MYKSTDDNSEKIQHSAGIQPPKKVEGNGVQFAGTANDESQDENPSDQPNPTLEGEELITLSEAAEILGVSRSRAYVYCIRGLNDAVQLESVLRDGRRRFTSREAIHRFGRMKRVLTDRLPARYRSPEENKKRLGVMKEMARDVLSQLGIRRRE